MNGEGKTNSNTYINAINVSCGCNIFSGADECNILTEIAGFKKNFVGLCLE